MLMGVVAATASRNCDVFNFGQSRENGVYDILVRGRIVEMFCEFDQNGFSWMVRFRKKYLIENIIS